MTKQQRKEIYWAAMLVTFFFASCCTDCRSITPITQSSKPEELKHTWKQVRPGVYQDTVTKKRWIMYEKG